MEPLIIQATKSSPSIVFHPEREQFEVKGHSYPENAAQFYKPVLDWLTAFFTFDTLPAVSFHFYLIYLNTSSSKFMLALFDLLENLYQEGKQITVQWFYDQENEIALDCGEFFKTDRNLPFQLIENKDNRMTL